MDRGTTLFKNSKALKNFFWFVYCIIVLMINIINFFMINLIEIMLAR